MSQPQNKIESFLKYKEAKLKSIAEIEAKRLEDLKDARSTIFKYALPSTVIDAAAGAFGTLITGNVLILLPVALFIVLIFFLARSLDREKYAERVELMEYTEVSLYEIRSQEIELLRRSSL